MVVASSLRRVWIRSGSLMRSVIISARVVSAGRVTVWALMAVGIRVVSVVARRGERFWMVLRMRVRPAVCNAVGVDHFISRSRTPGWLSR